VSSTHLEAELGKVDNNEEIVDGRVHIVSILRLATFGIVRPRPQKDGIENNNTHDNSAEPIGADHSVPYHPMHPRPSVFLCLHSTTLGALLGVLTLLFGLVALHQFPIYLQCFVSLISKRKKQHNNNKTIDVTFTSLLKSCLIYAWAVPAHPLPVATSTEIGSDQSAVRSLQGSDLTADWSLSTLVLVWVRSFIEPDLFDNNIPF